LPSPTCASITASGRHFPSLCLGNRYFYETLGLDTTEEWIRSRTGIRERRKVDPAAGESTATMAAEAARACLRDRGMGAERLDCILVSTVSPDLGFPPVACMVQDAIGARNAWAYDVEAACTGFLYALSTAAMMVESGRCRRVLVIGSDTMSSILDYTDRSTCVLFGDGAGAVLVEATSQGGFEDWSLHADGSGVRHLYRTGGGLLHGRDPAHSPLPQHEFVHQEGNAVFRFAVRRMVEVLEGLLKRNGLTAGDVDLVVPHQANVRILDAVRAKIGIPEDRWVVTLQRYANTTSATIPTSLDIAREEDRIAPGDRVVLCAVGGGFTWGATLLNWTA
jgi:3-oxoacyl-[acyl-carrier-protein] synthase III